MTLLGADYFILVIDLLVLYCFFWTILSYEKKKKRLFGGDYVITIFVFLYIISIFLSIVADNGLSFLGFVKGLRNVSYWVVIFFISSYWMKSYDKVEKLIRVSLLGALIALLWGFRQMLTGLYDFELQRIGQMGNVINEIYEYGRVRIPGTFGDPATYSFFMMSSFFCALIYAKCDDKKCFFVDYRIIALLFFIGMLSSMVRAPIMGLLIGVLLLCALLVVYGIRFEKKYIYVPIFVILSIFFLFYLVDFMLAEKILYNSDSYILEQIDHYLLTATTLVPELFLSDNVLQRQLIRDLSQNMRLQSIYDSVQFMMSNVYGGGLGSMTLNYNAVLSFYPLDVGYFFYGLNLGFLGMMSIIVILIRVLFLGIIKIFTVSSSIICFVGVVLLSCWIAMVISCSVTMYFSSEVVSVYSWLLAGAIINLDKIDFYYQDTL
ncbi:MAG: hypothetical protein J7D60_09965 [Prosthecochloris sp.]|nr:hypothetical protein [Prosthecochloris sp.]